MTLQNTIKAIAQDVQRKEQRLKGKIIVECMECGKVFTTKSMLPTCPRCKGTDIGLA